ncbi:MAG: UDP-N-acetylmuramate dehydrogenase [Desulfurobacteriaceae bacterium]
MEVKELPAKVLTTIGIGSSYPVFFPKDVSELKSLLKNEKVFVIGGGSNTVLPPKIESKLVSLKHFKKVEFREDSILLGAGVLLREIIKLQIKKGFSLFEFLAGVPKATVGGLVAQNAGAFGKEIKERLLEVIFLDLETFEIVSLKDFENFSYRSSPFPEKGIILEAKFKITRNKKVKEEIKRFIFTRLSKQPPFFVRTSGSTFKNPKGFSAGKLLDMAGFKGFKVGKVKFSEFHANFCINEGGSFEDFKTLVELAKKKVKEKFNVNLDLEVKIPS